MIKETKLLLGGEERVLKFGSMGFFKHVGEVYEGDPLDMITGVSNPKKQYELILAVIYGGLMCAGGTYTKDQVDAWVQELDFESAASVLQVMRQAMAGNNGQAGEVEAQAMVNA